MEIVRKCEKWIWLWNPFWFNDIYPTKSFWFIKIYLSITHSSLKREESPWYFLSRSNNLQWRYLSFSYWNYFYFSTLRSAYFQRNLGHFFVIYYLTTNVKLTMHENSGRWWWWVSKLKTLLNRAFYLWKKSK